jgi:outer membrane protein assembly factor BamB
MSTARVQDSGLVAALVSLGRRHRNQRRAAHPAGGSAATTPRIAVSADQAVPSARANARYVFGTFSLFGASTMLGLILWASVLAVAPGWTQHALSSGSMGPAIQRGDVVLTSPAPAELEPPQVVAFTDPTHGDSIVHRIVDRNDDGTYVTRGDANTSVDSTPLDPERILGVGRILVPLVGYVAVWLAEGRIALVVGVLALAVLLGWGSRFALFDRYDPWLTPEKHHVASRAKERRLTTGAVVSAVLVMLAGPVLGAFIAITAPSASWATGQWITTPENLTVTGTSKTTVDLAWAPVDAEDYQLRWAPVGEDSWTETGATTTTRLSVEGLEPGTSYEFQVRARTNSGDVRSSWSDSVAASTRAVTHVYTASHDKSSRSLDTVDGTLVDTFNGHTEEVYAVAVDADGYVYTASRDRTVRKRDPAGNQVWSFTGHTDEVFAVAVDARGFVYTGSKDGSLRKLDADGDEVWSATGLGDEIYSVAVDAHGHVYGGSKNGYVSKLDPNGDGVGGNWPYRPSSDEIHGIAVDADGYVYTGSSDKNLRKQDPDGKLVWAVEHGNRVYGVAVDRDGSVYTADRDERIRRIDPQDGSVIWSFRTGDRVRAVAVDHEGYVYSGSENDRVHALDPDGNELWSYRGHSGHVRGVAVDPGAFTTAGQGRPPIPGDLTVTSTTHIAAELTWSPVTSAEGYRVRWREVGDASWTVSDVTTDATMLVWDLQTDTSYNFQVRAESSGGPSVWSPTVTATTKGPPPLPATPTDLVMTGTTRTAVDLASIDLVWSPAAYADDYRIQWSVAGTNEWTATDLVRGTSMTIEDLQLGTPYEFQVRAENITGTSPWSASAPGTTAALTHVYTASIDDSSRMLDGFEGTAVGTHFTGHGNDVYAVAVDVEGNIYTAGKDKRVRRRSQAGTETWRSPELHGEPMAVAVDADGYVYSGDRSGYVRKMHPADPTTGWTVLGHANFEVRGVAVDADGYVYSVGTDYAVRKTSPSGAHVWSFTGHEKAVHGVAVDGHGNVYSASVDETVRKIDSAGDEVWTFDGHTHEVYAVAVDAAGSVYSGSRDHTVRKLSASGNQLWSFNHGERVRGVAVDLEGSVYSGGENTHVRKISANGVGRWSYTSHTGHVRGVAVDPGVFTVSGSAPLDPPTTPDGLQVTDTTHRTVDLSWEPVEGAGDYRLQWREDGNEEWTQGRAAEEPTGTVEGLVPDTDYELQVRAENAAGASDWSASVAHTTLVQPPPAPPEGLEATGSTHRSVDLAWDETDEADDYVVRWRIEDAETWTLSDEIVGTTTTVGGLQAETTYEFQVRARNLVGSGDWSSTHTKTTDELPSPEGLAATGSTHRTMDLAWETVEDAAEYRVRWRASDADEWVETDATGDTELTVEGLEPATTYELEVRAENEHSTGDWSAAIEQTTEPLPLPSTPEQLTATATSWSTVELTWESAFEAEEYRVRWSEAGQEAWTETAALAETSTTVGGFDPETAYDFQVRAENATGESDWSATVTETTDEPPPPPDTPENLIATTSSWSSIDVTWGAAAWADEYRLRWREDGATDWEEIAGLTATSTGLDHLDPDTTYEFEVRGEHALAVSDWSATVTADTDPPPPMPVWHDDQEMARVAHPRSSTTVSAPAGLVDGDLLVMFAYATNSNRTFVPPSGFNLIREEKGTDTPYIAAYWKLADGESPPYPVEWTGTGGGASHGAVVLGRVSGHDPDFPIDTSSGVRTGSATQVTIPSLTPTTSASLLVSTAMYDANGTEFNAPPAMDLLWTATGQTPRHGGASQNLYHDGPTGSRTFSWTASGPTAGVMFNIRPAGLDGLGSSAGVSTMTTVDEPHALVDGGAVTSSSTEEPAPPPSPAEPTATDLAEESGELDGEPVEEDGGEEARWGEEGSSSREKTDATTGPEPTDDGLEPSATDEFQVRAESVADASDGAATDEATTEDPTPSPTEASGDSSTAPVPARRQVRGRARA